MRANAPGLSEGLFYEDTLPLGWREIGTVLPAQALNLNITNEQLLRYLAAIDERAEAVDETHSPAAQEWARLDLKLNLLLDMVGRLLSRQVAVPEPVPVKLGADRIQWLAAQALPPGTRLAVEVYPDSRYPSALRLFGTVEKATPQEKGCLVDLRYTDMSETVRNALEKMIFRHHRRVVAHARHSAHR